MLLLLLQGGGIGAEGLKIMLQVSQGPGLMAQEALQLFPLVLEAVKLGLMLCFQRLQPGLQGPARWTDRGEPMVFTPNIHLPPASVGGAEYDSCAYCAETQRPSVSGSG